MSVSVMKTVILSSEVSANAMDMSRTSSGTDDTATDVSLLTTQTPQSKSVLEMSTSNSPITPSRLQSSYDGYTSGTQGLSIQDTTAIKSSPMSSKNVASLPYSLLKTDVVDMVSHTSSISPELASLSTPTHTKYTKLSSSDQISKSSGLAASAMKQVARPSVDSISDISSLKSLLSSSTSVAASAMKQVAQLSVDSSSDIISSKSFPPSSTGLVASAKKQVAQPSVDSSSDIISSKSFPPSSTGLVAGAKKQVAQPSVDSSSDIISSKSFPPSSTGLVASAKKQVAQPSVDSSSDILSSKSFPPSSTILQESSDILRAKLDIVSIQLSSVQKRSLGSSVPLPSSIFPVFSTVTATSTVVPSDPSVKASATLDQPSKPTESRIDKMQSDQGSPTIIPTRTKGTVVKSTPTVIGPVPSVTPSKPVIPSSTASSVAPVFIPNKNGPMMTSAIPPLGPISTTASVPPATATVLSESLPLILGVSLCGVGLVLFFITFTIFCCLRKKPSKNNKNGVRTHDLWVSTTATSEMGLHTTVDPLPGFESITETILTDYRKSLTNGQKGSNSDEVRYKALHSYEVTQEGQLAFRKGDNITVLEKTSDGWWKGTLEGREGWFPGSFVRELGYKPSTDGDEKKDEDDPDSGSQKQRISSFLLSKEQRPRSLHLPRCPSDGYGHLRQLTPKRDSWALGKEVSIPRAPQMEKKGEDSINGGSTSHLYLQASTAGRRYHVLHPYSANFKTEITLEEGEIIRGIERDKNGWMKGQREATGETGWFPAVYVQEVKDPASPSSGYIEDAQIYRQLLANCNDSKDQEVTCIEHVAVCPFAAEKDHDLSFDTGDTILVFDTLENGWWLGCHGDDVGWFPGAYVQIVTDGKSYVDMYDSPKSNKSSTLPANVNLSTSQLSVRSDDNMSVASDMSGRERPGRLALEVSSPGRLSTFSGPRPDHSASNLSVQSRSDDDISVSSKGSDKRIKPKRKAPKPPVDSPGGSKLPTPIKPTRQAPAPPGQSHSTPEQRGIAEVLGVNKQEPSLTKVISEYPRVEISITQNNSMDKSKPAVPKRFVKPKLVKVPRRKLDLKKATHQRTNQVSRSPPPPRPPPPNVSFHSPSTSLRSPNMTAEETTSLENMSNYLSSTSGFNQTEDQSGSLYKDMDITSMSVNDSVTDEKLKKDDCSHLMPKLQRQNALVSDDKSVELRQDTASPVRQDTASPVSESCDDVVDGNMDTNNKTYTIESVKPKASRIPQFNRQNSDHARSSPEDVKSNSPDPVATHSHDPVTNCIPDPVATYNPDPVRNYIPEPVATYSPDPVTTCSSDPVATHSPDPVTNYIPDPVATYSPDPVAMYSPDPILNYIPDPTMSYDPDPNPDPITTYNQDHLETFSPEPVAAYNPDPVLVESPDPVVSYSPVSTYGLDPISTFNHNPITTYYPDPIEPYSPDPVASYSPKTFSTYKPDAVTSYNQNPVKTYVTDPTATYSAIHVVSGPPSGYTDIPVSSTNGGQESVVLPDSPSAVYSPSVEDTSDKFEHFPDEKGDRVEEVCLDDDTHSKIPKARPPVAPKPKGIPQPKIHYIPDTSSEEVNPSPDKKISQESPSTRRRAAGQTSTSKSSSSPSRGRMQESPASRRKAAAREPRSGIPVNSSPVREIKSGIPVSNSPTREVKSGIPVNNSPTREVKSGIPVHNSPGREARTGIPVNSKSPKKSPHSKNNERSIPVRENSGGNTPKPNPHNDSIQNEDDVDAQKNKPQRPSKPPDTSKKQKGKAPDSNQSKLPKLSTFRSPSPQTKETDNRVISPPKQGKRSIPVAKPARPPPPKSPPTSPPTSPTVKVFSKGDNMQTSPGSGFSSFGKTNGLYGQPASPRPLEKRSLRKTVRSYQGRNEGELSFDEGSFIMEVTEDEDNPGWFIGMLADGSTGLYHGSFVDETPDTQQTTV